jgi:hypothetical protein
MITVKSDKLLWTTSRSSPRIQHQKSWINLVAEKPSKERQSKDLRDTSILRKRETTSSNNIRWSSKQKCVEIGSCLGSASLTILAVSHMGKMSFIRRPTSPLTIRPSYVTNSTQLPIVPMGTGASSYTLSSTYLTQSPLTTPRCWRRTPGCPTKEQSPWRMDWSPWTTSTSSPLRDLRYSRALRIVSLSIASESSQMNRVWEMCPDKHSIFSHLYILPTTLRYKA